MGGRPTQKIPFSADVSLSRFYSISICVVYLVGVRPKERERVVARRQKGTERNQKKRLRAFRMSIMISLSDGKGERERSPWRLLFDLRQSTLFFLLLLLSAALHLLLVFTIPASPSCLYKDPFHLGPLSLNLFHTCSLFHNRRATRLPDL